MLVLDVRLNSKWLDSKRMGFFVVWEDLLGFVLRGVTVSSEELKGKLL